MTGRRVAAVAAAALLAVAGLVAARRATPERVRAVAGAVAPTPAGEAPPLPVLAPGPAPDVAALASGWLNTAPLGPVELKGRVVLYDLWTFGCVNCQRTTPYLRAWHQRYAADGLVVLGVHTPEFAYEADPANVADAVEEAGIAYPVALDPDKRVWRAFENHWWPSFFLHDRAGARRYTHIGEGAYAETEDAIRSLLGVDPASPRATVPDAA